MTTVQTDNTKGGLREVIRVGGPASLSMLNNTLLQFVDGLMVSRIGPDVLAGQFIGGIFAFIPTSLAIGAMGVVNTFVSQNLGAGKPHRCGQYAWAGLALAAIYSAILTPLLLVFAGSLFDLMPHTDMVHHAETAYFRYMNAGMFLFLAANVLEQFFFGIHRPTIVLVTSLAANLLNVVLDYVMIFGKLGLPAMGLDGAAIATLISAGFRLAVMLMVFLAVKMHRQFATRNLRGFRIGQCFDLIRIGWPAGVLFTNDICAWSIFTAWLVGRFGTASMAASTIVQRFISLSFMPAVGLSIAASAIVGKYIGEGKPDLARRRTHTAVKAAIIYMGICGLAFLFFGKAMIRAFAVDPVMGGDTTASVDQVVNIGTSVLICAAVFQMFDALGIVYSGALRGAGDTFVPMFAGIGMSWSVIVGGGLAIVHFAPQWQAVGPWVAASAYVILLGLFMVMRFESGKWRKIDLLGKNAPPPPAIPDGHTSPMPSSGELD